MRQANMGHKTPHQGARCGRRIEIGTRSTRRMRAAADCARSAREMLWGLGMWPGKIGCVRRRRRRRRLGRKGAVRSASVRCGAWCVRCSVRGERNGGTLRSDLQSIVTRGRRSAVAHRGLAARWIRCMSKYWAVLSSPGVCACVRACACVWVGCCIVSYRAAPRGWAGAATGVRGLLWRACFDSSRKGWVRAA